MYEYRSFVSDNGLKRFILKDRTAMVFLPNVAN